MFNTVVTLADGTTSNGTCNETEAIRLLTKAVQRGYSVEATRSGGAVIVRMIPASTDRWTLPRKHTVTFEPVTPVGTVTQVQRRDLVAITRRRAGSWLVKGRIHAGLYSIPPAAAGRLVQRGLVTINGTDVSVSLVARLAMLAQDHHTTTSEPAGYRAPIDMAFRDSLVTGRPVTLVNTSVNVGLNKPGGRAGKCYYRDSLASCSCRRWSYPAEDRDDARRRAHDHRQEMTAAMVRDLYLQSEPSVIS